jgi:hypothetical protein
VVEDGGVIVRTANMFSLLLVETPVTTEVIKKRNCVLKLSEELRVLRCACPTHNVPFYGVGSVL